MRTPYDVVILTSHRHYYYQNQKVETLPLHEEHSGLYDLPVQRNRSSWVS